MKRILAVLAAVLLGTATASAQSYPDDPGGGNRLGIESLNNSGQVGSITLFGGSGGAATRAVVEIKGANARPEAVRIYRGQSCDDVSGGRPAYVLSNLSGGGMSRSAVRVSLDRLLSGNYNLVVFSSTAPGARPVACGHLYR